MNDESKSLNSQFLTHNFKLFSDTPTVLYARPNLPFSPPNDLAPKRPVASAASPNGQAPRSILLFYVASSPGSKRLQNVEVAHIPQPELLVVSP